MRGVASGGNLEEAKALAQRMSAAEYQEFMKSLKASHKPNTGTAEHRLANVKAAAQSADPKKKRAYDDAVRSLRGLGFEIDSIAASGSTRELEAAMKQRSDWRDDTARRIVLKSNLAAVGAIS